MAAAPGRSIFFDFKPTWVFAVLAAALALRLIHLSSTFQSPLSYQPGPDEDYYQRFGAAVAGGSGADSPEFTFMDPGYGYLLGCIFKLAGVNLFAVYLLQALLDTATAYGILVAGRLLDRPRAGLVGAVLYGVTSTAIMFCSALLKEVWVASFVIWWVVCALGLCRNDRKIVWFCFGVFCGVGIALRSTLALLAGAAMLLPGLTPPSGVSAAARARAWAGKAALLACGMAVSLAPWSLRNHHADATFSPLPHNGGIVLHQVYNAENPQSAIWIPAFVNYSHPSEIWRGYASEAERRAGRPLSPPEIDGYWKDQALAFMRAHPRQVIADMLRKSMIFLAATEVPNNRSSVEERMFSRLLAILPPPMIWLLAMGLAGLVLLAVQDRRWMVVAVPIAISWFTMAVFWAEDRFRFHAAPALALLSGIWIEGLAMNFRERRGWTAAFFVLAAVIGAVSGYLGTRVPPPIVHWDRVVWGYIKMGKLQEARALAQRISGEQPDNAPLFEALGYLAARDGRYQEAVRNYTQAVSLRPRSYLAHYNLARAYLALGNNDQAAAEARAALDLERSPDTLSLMRQIESASR